MRCCQKETYFFVRQSITSVPPGHKIGAHWTPILSELYRNFIILPYHDIRKYIPKGVSYEKTGEFIKKALIFYQENHSKSSRPTAH